MLLKNVNVSYSFDQRVLKSNNYKAYKIMPFQTFIENDAFLRTKFCQVILDKYWTDEATFPTGDVC